MENITVELLKDFLSKTYEDWSNSIDNEFIEAFDYMSLNYMKKMQQRESLKNFSKHYLEISLNHC